MPEQEKKDLVPLASGDQPPITRAGALIGLFMPDDRRAVCSFDLTSAAGRELLQKCEEAPDEPVREFVNRTLRLQHIYAKTVEHVDAETSEVRPYLRICLIDITGAVHACGSEGIRDGVARLIAGHGPPPWKNGIPVEIKLKALGQQKQRLYLLEVFDAKKGGTK